MIDTALIGIIPPIVAAILTYVVASKRARLQYAKTISDIQSKAVEVVAAQEEKMRKEIWAELDKIRTENQKLREDLATLKERLQNANDLADTLREEVRALKSSLDVTTKDLVRSNARIKELENGANNKTL